MTPDSTAEGWYVLRGQTQAGPYSWEHLYGFAQAGHVTPDDLVWQGDMPGWMPASRVPGLFAGGLAATDGATAGPSYDPTPAPMTGGAPQPPKKRGWVIPVAAAAAAVVLVVGGVAAFFLLRGGSGTEFGGASDLTGIWTGTLTIDRVDIPDAVWEQARQGGGPDDLDVGCDTAMLESLKSLEGQTMPMALEIAAEEGGGGEATFAVDSSDALEEGAPGEPQTLPIRWSKDSFEMSTSEEGGTVTFTGSPRRKGSSLVLSGDLHAVGTNETGEVTVTGSWTVTKK